MKLFSFILTSLLLVNTLFTAEAPTSWVIGTEYENGSIVTYGKNTYKALKDVPESVGGYPNTLIDYWININKLMPGLDHNTSLAYPKGVKVASGNVYYSSIADYIPVGISITNTNYWEQTNFNFDKDEANTLNIPNASEIIDNNYTPPEDDTQNAKIVSVNVRGTIGTRDNGDLRIMGFKLTDSSDVLMRGVGPQLEEFTNGLLSSDVLLPDPSMFLYKYKDPQNTRAGSNREYSGDNGDYSTNANIAEIDAVRAVLNPVVPFHPKQAASMPSLDGGFYTLQVEDTSGATGIGWAGVDLPSSSTAAFTHVSARGLVQTTEYMFGGFQITGTGTRKIFLRGRGSSLTQYNVPNVTSDPLIVLFKYNDGPGTPSTEIDQNDDYTSETNSAEIKTLSTSLYGWPEIEAKESALLLDLEPGYYTIQLRSRSFETDGNGWIGIDDVTDQ
jgi:hypothetical protein